MNGGSVVGINKSIFKIYSQIGDNLWTIHNDQLVFSNRKDIVLTHLARFNIWLVQNCQTEEDHLSIKIVTGLLLYNASELLNMNEICLMSKNKLKIHLRGMATLKKSPCAVHETGLNQSCYFYMFRSAKTYLLSVNSREDPGLFSLEGAHLNIGK